MIFLDNKTLLMQTIRNYINNDISKVPEFYEDVKLFFSLKRECSKISNGHNYNILVVKNLLITAINCFPSDYKNIIDDVFKRKYENILNTLYYHLKLSASLISLDEKLLKELDDVTYKRK